MIQNKVYSEIDLWLESFKAIGGDAEELLRVEEKQLKNDSGLEFHVYYNVGREQRGDSSGGDSPGRSSTSHETGM